MILDELALKHGTDKGPTGHWYTPHYHQLFGSIRFGIETMCEVGIGNGASLLMWRDYFLNAQIYGVDQNRIEDLGDRITTYESEQTNCATLDQIFEDNKLEIIVEDASHIPEKTIDTLGCMWGKLASKGWYVIEDMCIDLFPPLIAKWYGERAQEIRQLRLLKNRANSCLIIFIQKQ